MMHDLLRAGIEWEKVGPGQWVAMFHGARCVLTMNDFPDEPLYAVVVGANAIDVEDAPASWHIQHARRTS